MAILIAQFLCGLATVTSASRMLFAFSRDGGLPVGSAALAKVSPTWRTPVDAIWTAAILEMLFVLLAQFISVGGTNIYTIVVNSHRWSSCSCRSPCRSCSACWPSARRNGPSWVRGTWALGCSSCSARLSIIGMIVIFYIAIQPPNDKVLYITIGFIVLTAVLWFGFENRRFQGPPIGDQIAKRQAAITAAEAGRRRNRPLTLTHHDHGRLRAGHGFV